MKLLLFALLTFAIAPVHAASFDLRFDRLADALGLLPTSDRSAVDGVIDLIKKGDHETALTRLNELNRANPDNSSLRLLTSYAMLELGNLLGAYEQAEKAHEAGNGNSYKCWFYSKLAFLKGDTTACKRELNHVKKAGDMPAEVKALEKELKSKKS